MFPEDFVLRHVLAYSSPGDLVFDPFSGRGTTILESLLNRRNAIGLDINPVAACVSGAKANPPSVESALERIADLERASCNATDNSLENNDFFQLCFHADTLRQIGWLRENLDWRHDQVDQFLAAIILGALHGESHRTTNCLSNRMPRTISTKPGYSVRWWRSRGLEAPKRDVFAVLRRLAVYRLDGQTPLIRGSVKLGNVRDASEIFPTHLSAVDLIITSPPYLDTTDYMEDQWLRLWFLDGAPRPIAGLNRDDRHTSVESYWSFLSEAWAGCAGLVHRGTKIVLRIGGARLERANLIAGVESSLESGFGQFSLQPLGEVTTTEIRNRQTNVFRPGTKSKRYEHDFIYELS